MSAWSMLVTPRSSMKSLVSVSISFGTSLKLVRRRLPASVSVATQPVSEVDETTKGESSTGVWSSVWVWVEVEVGGGSVWPVTARETVRPARIRAAKRTRWLGFMGCQDFGEQRGDAADG